MSDQLVLQATRRQVQSASELTELIERLVGDRELRPGDRLPPIRHLAAELGLAPNTVSSAIRRLVERGVLVTRGRRGTFVAEPRAFVAEPPVPEGALDLASGNPDPAFLPDLAPVLARISHRHVLYGEPSVLEDLERASRRWLPADSSLAAAPMAVVGGALDGVERALSAHLRPGDRVAVEAPGWPAFVDLVRGLGLEPVPVPVDERGMQPAALRQVMGAVAAVVMTVRVHNPTGAAIDAERAGELRRLLAEHPGVLVVEDDHAGFICELPLVPVGAGRTRWVLIQSSSKSFGPDLRTAVLYGDELTVRRVQARQAAGAGWVSHLLQRTLASLLDDPATPSRLEEAAAAYAHRRRALLAALADHGIAATGRTGFNVWAWVPDEQAALRAALEAGFAIRAGERWRLGTPPAVRITTARLPPERADEVARALAVSAGRVTGRTA